MFASRLTRLISRRRTQRGFTIVELLVALVMGSIITGTLLFAVVEVLQLNQREDNRAETQRDMKVAMDYISTELREAVFVYDGLCLTGSGTPGSGVSCPSVLRFLPSVINTAPNTIPVIAFWRVSELPQTLMQACANNATQIYADPPPAAINGVPCLSRRTYSLVVYYLDTTTGGNWRGLARIRRYELSQFNDDGTRNTGWVDPTLTNNNFLGWPLDSRGNNLQVQNTLPDGSTNLAVGAPSNTVNPTVLTDFVDAPMGSGQANNAIAGTTTTSCPNDPSTRLPAFVRTPTNGSTSFYACVRGGGVDTSQGAGVPNNPGGRNQEISLFIRGNAAGRPGVPRTGRLTFEIETRVLTRGSYEKNPAPQ